MLHITPWERSALEFLAVGTTTRELADHLGTTESDVDTKLRALFVRMGAATRHDAVAAASRRGLLRADVVAKSRKVESARGHDARANV
jgi:DNA-binding NarL/FixJ family response regulator